MMNEKAKQILGELEMLGERRYHFTCPKDCWNKKGEYEVY